jgi:ligand-binding sensor domain-containing protein/uncharacterized membrane protein YphA (DoxX/SURF4 family)
VVQATRGCETINAHLVFRTSSSVRALRWLLIWFLSPDRLALAADSIDSISQYAHTAWNRVGAFPDTPVSAFAQTQDGYLWLGTEDAGLLRFDGQNFNEGKVRSGQALSSKSVYSLLASQDGGLWIGARSSLGYLKDGNLSLFAERNGLAIGVGGAVIAIHQDLDGVVWVGTLGYQSGGLFRIDNGHVQSLNGSGEFARTGIYDILRENSGNLWIGGYSGLALWDPQGLIRTVTQTTSTQITSIAQGHDGTLWFASSRGLLSYSHQQFKTHSLMPRGSDGAPRRVLVDHDGGVWVGTVGQGLFHFNQGRWERMTHADGLSSDKVFALYEDREGNVWAGTARGIDRFRKYKVKTISKREGLPGDNVMAVVASQDGKLCAGIRAVGIHCFPGGKTHRLQNSPIYSMFADHDGQLAIGARGVAGRLTERGFTSISKKLTEVYSIAEDREGDLWLADTRQGLFRLSSEGQLDAVRPESFAGKPITFLLSDREGGLWIGLVSGGLMLYKHGDVRSFSSSEALGSGYVASIFEDHAGTIWVATEGGLSRYDGDHFTTLTTRNGLPCDTIHDLIEDDLGSLWLRTGCGLVRAKLADLMAATKIPYELFGPADGYRVTARPVRGSTPRVAKTRDGRLWFVTTDGIAMIDPKHIPRNTIPPPVYVQQIAADGKFLNLTGVGKLPPTLQRLQIDYTALSFADPDRVLFRYKLEGFDRDWIDAGTRRQAFYTNLRPGPYRFRVIACNNDGLWNETGASFPFEIEASFLQMGLFAWFCGGMLLLFIWAFYWLRLQRTMTLEQLLETMVPVYPEGFPGVGLLLARFWIGSVLLGHAAQLGPFATNAVANLDPARVLEAFGGALLLAGFLTPVVSVLLVTVVVVQMAQHAATDSASASLIGVWEYAVPVVLAILILTGPGAYSIDNRTFGRKFLTIKGPKLSQRY